ncbi:MAG: mechanosensitive ion channel family protein [Vicinamibacteria bacterium]
MSPLDDLLVAYPPAFDLLMTGAILVAAWLFARVLSFLAARSLAPAVRRREAPEAGELLGALRGPFHYGVFLIGAYLALHRIDLQQLWLARLDKLLFALAVLVVMAAALRSWDILVRLATRRPPEGDESPLSRELAPLVSKAGRMLIVLVATITALEGLGVNVNSLVVSLGVGSLAVGLAAQDTLANMFAGLTLMLDRPFLTGDRIQLASGELGDVVRIGMRATRIRTLDDTILVVPNAVLVKEKLINRSQPTAALTTRIEVNVAHGSDLDRVSQELRDAALASPLVDPSREPLVLLQRFAESSLAFLLIFWVLDHAQQGLAVDAVLRRIDERFRAAGIEIPYPTHTIRRARPEGER